MKRIRWILLCLLATQSVQLYAGEETRQSGCYRKLPEKGVVEIRSLHELPQDIISFLRLGGKIADEGVPFANTDVVSDQTANRAFQSAQRYGNCIHVVIIQGGRGSPSPRLFVFELNDSGWRPAIKPRP